jgi:hypothetical protein
MSLIESQKIIMRLLSETEEIDISFVDEEVIVDNRIFLLTGYVSASLIDDSDYDRETGYGRRVYPSYFEYNIERVVEILEDDAEVDVSNDPEVISVMEEFMKEKLESQ